MYKLFLALRYLRTRRISLLSVLGVAFGVMTLLIVTSIMGGFARDLRARIRGMTAHITISSSRVSKYRMMENWQDVAAELKTLGPDIVAVSPQLEWPIMIDKGPKGAVLVGIDPAMEAGVSGFSEHLLDGHEPDFESPGGRSIGTDGQNRPRVPGIFGSNVLGPHVNKDVVFLAAGPGANASIADCMRAVNRRDGFEILTADDEFDGGECASGSKRDEGAQWIRKQADTPVKDMKERLREAFRRLAVDPKKETRYGYVVVMTPGAVSADDIRAAWLQLEPEQRAILTVTGPGVSQREPGKEPLRAAWVVLIQPGPQAMKKFVNDLGNKYVDSYAVKITTITPKTIREAGPVGIKPANRELAVIGAFNSGMSEYDNQIIYVPLQAAQEFLDEPGMINKLRVRIRDYDHADEMKEKIEKLFKGRFDVSTWMEEKAILLQAVAVERTLNGVILFFIVLVAAFSILAILSMLVTEKTRDIGILRAMGATVPGIMTIFLGEGLIIGSIGCGLGVGLAVFILRNLNPLADWVYSKTGWYPFPKDIYLLDQIPHEINLPVWVLIISATLFVCLLAALYPAWKAARLNPVEALRYE